MKVVLSARVEADIARQLEFSIERFGEPAAERIFMRVDTFLHKFLPAHPRTGKWIAEAALYESWIARTPFVAMYRIEPDELTITVVAMFHHAQDRSAFTPNE